MTSDDQESVLPKQVQQSEEGEGQSVGDLGLLNPTGENDGEGTTPTPGISSNIDNEGVMHENIVSVESDSDIMRKGFSELSQILSKFVGEISLRNKGDSQAASTNENKVEGGDKKGSTTAESTQMMGGNQLSTLQAFNWDPTDKGEAERFVNNLRKMAVECSWTDFRLRTVFESKLSPRARSVYYEGLGEDEEINIDDRLKEFIRLFSRKPTEDEGQKLFFQCVQGKDERVVPYKLRLVRLSKPLKVKLGNNEQIYEEFLVAQFKQGLNPNIKIEILKCSLNRFEELVNYAIKIEECIKVCSTRNANVATIGTEKEGMDSLSKRFENFSKEMMRNVSEIRKDAGEREELIELRKQVERLTSESKSRELAERKRDSGQLPVKQCSYCNRVGHVESECWRKRPPVYSSCKYCKRGNHSEGDCYFNPQNKQKHNASPNNSTLNP